MDRYIIIVFNADGDVIGCVNPHPWAGTTALQDAEYTVDKVLALSPDLQAEALQVEDAVDFIYNFEQAH